MSNSWRQAYTQLTDFIAAHPEIEIGQNVTNLPGNSRPEFYQRFNAVRTILIEEKLPVLLGESQLLSNSYITIEKEVINSLGLSDLIMDLRLNRFLHDPMDELIRGLFDPLFDLLKANISIENFEQKAMQIVANSSRFLYQEGYEKWAILSLVKLLKADKLYQVTTRKFGSSEEQTRMRDGQSKEPVPPPKESKRLQFRDDPEAIFIVPDLIVKSTGANGHVGFKSRRGKAVAKAVNASEKRKWYPIDSVAPMISNMTLVYLAENPEDISLVADVERICKPDIIIFTRELEKWCENEGLNAIRSCHYSLKPALGTYVISREAVAEKKDEEHDEDIHILSVGLDHCKLEPIVSALINAAANK